MPVPDDLLSETRACDLLARLFRARGYSIARNIPFRDFGVSFHIDGWDAKARVGFEFLTSEDEDHDDLTLEEYKTLMDAQQRGELALFVIDEVEPVSVADLTFTVNEFLDEVADARKASRGSGRKTAAGPARSAAKGRKTAKKAARTAGGKPAAKPVARKTKAAATAKPTPRKAAKKTPVTRVTAKAAAKKTGKKPAKKRAR
jgi:hypothetical protein